MTVRIEKPSINVREKLAELDKPTGIAGEAMLRAETPQEQFNLIGAGRRNYALNGNFTVSQRGNYSTAASFTTGDYFVDRWRSDRGTVSGTRQRIAGGFDTGLNSIKVAATSSATSYIGLSQRWNQTELPHLYSDKQGDYVVFSGWLRSNSSKANWYIYNLGALDMQSHSGNGEWEYMVSKVPTASLNGNIDFNVFLYDGDIVPISSGDYVEIAMVQIEVNNTGIATPFEHRSYGEELALCQRYYQKIDTRGTMGHCTSNNYFQTCFLFNAPMRTTPSFSIDDPNRVTQYNVTDRNVSSWGIQQFSNGSTTQVNYLIQRSTGDTLSNANSYAWNDTSVSDFYLRLDAEL